MRGWVYMAIAAVCLAAHGGAAYGADEFPTRTVSIYVANAPGSQADLLARILAQGMSSRLGKNVIVENRPGVGGLIAARATAQAEPDGYTVMLGSLGVMAINPHVYASVPYDARKDFVGLAFVASSPNVFLVSAQSEVADLREFVGMVGKAGRPVNYGSLGPGATTNIVSQLFGREASLPVTEIAYKGETIIINDLVAGRLDFSVLPISSTLSYIRSGKLKALAVTSDKRTNLLPELPTTAEAGYGSVRMTQWYGLFAPAQTPEGVVAKLVTAAEAALADPDTQRRIAQLGVEPGSLDRPAFLRFFASQYEDYGTIVRRLGIKID